MNKTKKVALAVLAVAALSGCASVQVAEVAKVDAAPARAEETRVSVPMSGYGNMGGYRMRRLVAVAKTT